MANLWFPKYTKLDQADGEIQFTSTCAYVLAGACFCVMLYRFANSEAARGSGTLLTAAFWAIAGWRMRKRSLGWAIATVVCYPFMLPVVVFVFSIVGLLLIGPLFIFINGMRAARAYRRLSAVPQGEAQPVRA